MTNKELLKIITEYALRVVLILATILFIGIFIFVFLKTQSIMLDPRYANGVIREDIKWNTEYCKVHQCELQYITDKSKKIFDAGWIVLIGFVSSFLTWISNYLGRLSGLKEGKLLAENELLKKTQQKEES